MEFIFKSKGNMYQFINESDGMICFEVTKDERIVILNMYEDGILDADFITFPNVIDVLSKMVVKVYNPYKYKFDYKKDYYLVFTKTQNKSLSIDVAWDYSWCPTYMLISPKPLKPDTIQYFANRKATCTNYQLEQALKNFSSCADADADAGANADADPYNTNLNLNDGFIEVCGKKRRVVEDDI